jgi:hypothetical protein
MRIFMSGVQMRAICAPISLLLSQLLGTGIKKGHRFPMLPPVHIQDTRSPGTRQRKRRKLESHRRGQ